MAMKLRALGVVPMRFTEVFTKAISAAADDEGITPSCITCSWFDEKTELCGYMDFNKVPFNQRPPARVIAFGCPKYDDKDDIPF